MEPRECHVISPHQSERVESVSKSTIATTPGVDINSDSDDADPFPEIQPNRRRRRSLKENTESVNRTLERKNELVSPLRYYFQATSLLKIYIYC